MLSTLTGAFIPRTRTQFVVPFHAAAQTAITITNIAAANTFLASPPQFLNRYDLSGVTEGRLAVHLGSANGNVGSFIRLAYALTYPAAAANLLQIGQGVHIEVPLSGAANAIYVSSWLPLNMNARTDVILGLYTGGGDGVADPVLYSIVGQFR